MIICIYRYTYLYVWTFEVLTVLIDLFIVLCFVYVSIYQFICRFMYLPAHPKPLQCFCVFCFCVPSATQWIASVHTWHMRSCDNVRVQSATQRTASVQTLHMLKPVIMFVFEVRRNGQLRYELYTSPNLCWKQFLYVYVACPDPKFGAGEKKPLLLPVPWANIGILTLMRQTRFVALMVFIRRRGDTLPARLDEEWSLQRDDTPELVHLYLWIIVVQYICSHCSHYHQGRKPPQESKERILQTKGLDHISLKDRKWPWSQMMERLHILRFQKHKVCCTILWRDPF